jgi:hypothetical protein
MRGGPRWLATVVPGDGGRSAAGSRRTRSRRSEAALELPDEGARAPGHRGRGGSGFKAVSLDVLDPSLVCGQVDGFLERPSPGEPWWGVGRKADTDRLAWLRHRRGNGRDCTPASRGVFALSLLLAPAPQGISGRPGTLQATGGGPGAWPEPPVSPAKARVRYGSFGGAPSRIRTCDLRIRSPTLYPTELWARPTVPEELAERPGFEPGTRLNTR